MKFCALEIVAVNSNRFILALALAAAPALAHAADAAHGRTLFQQQCGLCHEAGAGGLGPSLKGVIGRKIAGDAAFAYTPALSAKTGTWSQESLAAFLENPSAAVPGTAMPVQIAAPADRADLAAYLATVK